MNEFWRLHKQFPCNYEYQPSVKFGNDEMWERGYDCLEWLASLLSHGIVI
jgi:hypothetical protein